MNVRSTPSQISSQLSSKRFFVRKHDLIGASIVFSSNENCCVKEKKHVQIPITKAKNVVKIKEQVSNKSEEFIIDLPKQTAISKTPSDLKLPLINQVLNNSWTTSSNELVENVMITRKRCYFSNEAISIKPITAIPGIGEKYGQALAAHGFIYARQLLGYYMILKDSEMFRKWLEYRFHIPKYRAIEITCALNEILRRIL